jgi:hypothetical protein
MEFTPSEPQAFCADVRVNGASVAGISDEPFRFAFAWSSR